jgi:hypothetical protein
MKEQLYKDGHDINIYAEGKSHVGNDFFGLYICWISSNLGQK